MVNVNFYIDKINECKVKATTREDRAICLKDVNREVVDFMEQKYGSNALGCYGRGNMESKNFGLFFVHTLDKTGQDFTDISRFDAPICRRGSDVLPAVTDNNKKIFFKTRGTTDSADFGNAEYKEGEEIKNHQETVNIANVISEDVPMLIHSDPINKLIATEGIKGDDAYGEFDDAPSMEIADALLFETMIGSWDRWNNIIREGKVIKQIDFGISGRHLSDRVKEHTDILDNTTKRILNDLRRGDKIDDNLKQAIKSDINWYWKNKKKIKTLAPSIFDEVIVDERVNRLSRMLDGETFKWDWGVGDLVKYEDKFKRVKEIRENNDLVFDDETSNANIPSWKLKRIF